MLPTLLKWLGFTNPLPVDLREYTPIFFELMQEEDKSKKEKKEK